MLLNYVVWDVNPYIFYIGERPIAWYGLLWAMVFLVGYYIMKNIYKREKIGEEQLDKLLMYMLVSPKQYYQASVLGSQYALSHQLNNVALVAPTGENLTNLSAVVSNAKNTQMIDEKMLNKIDSYEENTPF